MKIPLESNDTAIWNVVH